MRVSALIAWTGLLLFSTSSFGSMLGPKFIPTTDKLIPPVASVDLGDLMTPDEIAEEAAMYGDYSLLMNNVATTNIKSRPLMIVVNKSTQTMEVSLNGDLFFTWKISTGRGMKETAPSGKTYVTSTPTGRFTINERKKMHISRTWDNAKMPHAQFFIGGIALHATTPDHFEELGRPPGKRFKNSKGKMQMAGSGGCVRMRPEHARDIYEMVGGVGVENTLIVVNP